MKNQILSILLYCIIEKGIAQQIPVDKQKHFAVGAIVSELSYIHPTKHPFWNSVLAATAAGVAKETYDHSQGFKFDTGDVAATIAGGALTGSIMYLVTKKSKTKRKKL